MKQTIDDNFAVPGFINLLFISNTKLYYHNFIKKMNAKNLNWIFNPEKVVKKIIQVGTMVQNNKPI